MSQQSTFLRVTLNLGEQPEYFLRRKRRDFSRSNDMNKMNNNSMRVPTKNAVQEVLLLIISPIEEMI